MQGQHAPSRDGGGRLSTREGGLRVVLGAAEAPLGVVSYGGERELGDSCSAGRRGIVRARRSEPWRTMWVPAHALVRAEPERLRLVDITEHPTAEGKAYVLVGIG